MSKGTGSIWWIIIILVLLVLVFISLSERINEDYTEDEDDIEKRRIEEEKLLKEIEELEKRNRLYHDHKWKLEFTNNYLERLSEKRYKQFIRLLIFLGVLINIIIFLAIPDMSLLKLFGLNGAVFLGVNAFLGITIVYVSKTKEAIKDYIKTYIDSRIYKNRSSSYFEEKIRYYESEIRRIKEDISSKSNNLNSMKS